MRTYFAKARQLYSALSSGRALAIVVLVSGCTTSITDSGKLVDASADEWTSRRADLSVDVHGTAPAIVMAALRSPLPPRAPRRYTSMDSMVLNEEAKRIVLYVNTAELPSVDLLCNHPASIGEAAQEGRYAKVTAALCDGNSVISYSRAVVLASSDSPEKIRRNFGIAIDELFDVLQPGADDSDRQYED